MNYKLGFTFVSLNKGNNYNLKPDILIRIAYNISNLSDARYFAAYGFDWIIFDFGPGAREHKHLIYGIAEWISGAKIGIHVRSTDEIDHHMNNHPEITGFWLESELSFNTNEKYTFFSGTFIKKEANFFRIITSPDKLNSNENNQILDLTFNDPLSTDLNSISADGIAISGTEEDRPGFKSYGNMENWMDILEEMQS